MAVQNRYGVPNKVWSKWTDEARAVFDGLYRHMGDQSLYAHPGAVTVPAKQWDTTRWNAAWMAADMLSLMQKRGIKASAQACRRHGRPQGRLMPTREQQEDAAFMALSPEKQAEVLDALENPGSEFNALRALVGELRERLPGINEAQSQHVGMYLLKALWLGQGKPMAEVFEPYTLEAEKVSHLRLVPLDAPPPGPPVEEEPAAPAEPSNVIQAGMLTRLDVPAEKILNGALRRDLDTVMVLGYDKAGELYTASSMADGPEALWLLEMTKKRLLEIGDSDDPESPFHAA